MNSESSFLPKQKKMKKPSWTLSQSLQLLELIKENKVIILDKLGPNITCKLKRETWQKICTQINASNPLVQRTKEECEKKWYLLKSNAKAKNSDYKKKSMWNW